MNQSDEGFLSISDSAFQLNKNNRQYKGETLLTKDCPLHGVLQIILTHSNNHYFKFER